MIISKVIFILGVIALFALSDAALDSRNRRPKSSSSSSPSSSSSSSSSGKGKVKGKRKGGKCHGHGTCTYFIHAEQQRRNQWEGTSLKIEAPGGHITGTITAHGPTKDCVSKSGEHKGAFPKCFNAAAKFSINCGEKAEISWVSSDHRPNDNINYQLFQSAKAPHTQPPASEGFALAKESKNRQTLIVECGSSGDVNDPSKVTFGVFTTAKRIVPDESSSDQCSPVLWEKCNHDADCCEGKCYRKNSSYRVPCCEGGYCFERGPGWSACKTRCPRDWTCKLYNSLE
ncbi:hypothetical protein TrST_g2693 [Triparma strigata]|uniref:Uncharacterized protein n=1 Tax=Triparma strigata TaxID=1606541 RepID=A0A9W7EYD7_9STRA|nr:hypothetical protein TrST_g2693 [Triparma strigata]